MSSASRLSARSALLLFAPRASVVDHLDPTLDVVFKLLLTRKQALLADMLQGILGRPVGAPNVLNPGILGDQARDKQVVLDVRVALDDGSRAAVEMQRRTPANLASRLVYYGARDYGDQLVRGDDYHALKPTAVIAWLAEPLFPKLQRLHSIFELRERHTHVLLGDQLAFHLLQLSHRGPLSTRVASRYDVQVSRWARFLGARSEAELDELCAESRIMSLAKQTLAQISQEPEARRLAREREDAIRLYQDELAVTQAKAEARGRRRGRREGRSEGRAELLLKLLGLRFGMVSEAARDRVLGATAERIDAWAGRVLTARALDEVFDG